MKKTFVGAVAVVAVVVAIAFIGVGCSDSGGQAVNGEAEAFLGRFSGTETPGGVGGGGGGDNASTFKDTRDGKTYKKVTIGSQTWMAENLNYQTTSGSWCYGDNQSNCNTYGRLYDDNAGVNACPNGWHLPSSQEWEILTMRAGGWEMVGLVLKAKNGWNSGGNGDDDYGFTALPGGIRKYDGSFSDIGSVGSWRASDGVYFNDDMCYVHNQGKSDQYSVCHYWYYERYFGLSSNTYGSASSEIQMGLLTYHDTRYPEQDIPVSDRKPIDAWYSGFSIRCVKNQ